MRWTSRTRPAIEPDPRYIDPAVNGLRRDGPVTRFLGGSPAAVLVRLVLLSVLVGAVMMWLNVRPQDIIEGAHRFVLRFWNLGFDAFRQAGDYLLVGAMIVVPVFLISRLLSARRPR